MAFRPSRAKAATWDIFLTLRRESHVAVSAFKSLIRREIGAFLTVVTCLVEGDIFELLLPGRDRLGRYDRGKELRTIHKNNTIL